MIVDEWRRYNWWKQLERNIPENVKFMKTCSEHKLDQNEWIMIKFGPSGSRRQKKDKRNFRDFGRTLLGFAVSIFGKEP